MKPVDFHLEARLEILEAVEYYESQRTGRGSRFHQDLEETIRRIQLHPGIGQRHEKTIFRRFGLSRFPYLVYYRELADSIRIQAVSHGKRRPNYWIDRTLD